MSDSCWNLVTSISAWVATTQNLDVPVLPDEEELHQSVDDLRRRLRDGTWEDLNLEADDSGLAVLSRLCFELSNQCFDEDSTQREAAAAHELVSRLEWPADLFGERNEILSRLSLTAWRHAREFETPEEMLECQRSYQANFAEPSSERDCLEEFLATVSSERSEPLIDVVLSDVRSMYGLCEVLQQWRDAFPAKAAAGAAFLYARLENSSVLMDSERVYLSGALALLAGSSYRLLGRRRDAEEWLGRAQTCFSRTRNAEPDLAKLAYARLAMCYEYRRFEAVMEDVPQLLAQFQRLGMKEEESKILFVEASALKESGNLQQALVKFLALRKSLSQSDPGRLLGALHLKIGDLYSTFGLHHRAMEEYQRSLRLIRVSRRAQLGPDFKATVGETCRNMGQFEMAVALYREALCEYDALSMSTMAAYLRIILAETLLLAGRSREAEVEILAALPTIEKERMVEEGFAALSLLRESVHRCATDVTSLRALRERLNGDRQ